MPGPKSEKRPAGVTARDAVVATRDAADVSAALFNGGWARSYDGGRRDSWC
jgi:hypothetical protein